MNIKNYSERYAAARAEQAIYDLAARLGGTYLRVVPLASGVPAVTLAASAGCRVVALIHSNGTVERFAPGIQALYDQCSRARGLVSKLQRCPTFSGKGRSIHEHLSAITARQNRLRACL